MKLSLIICFLFITSLLSAQSFQIKNLSVWGASQENSAKLTESGKKDLVGKYVSITKTSHNIVSISLPGLPSVTARYINDSPSNSYYWGTANNGALELSLYNYSENSTAPRLIITSMPSKIVTTLNLGR
jgi:hypothetical protein